MSPLEVLKKRLLEAYLQKLFFSPESPRGIGRVRLDRQGIPMPALPQIPVPVGLESGLTPLTGLDDTTTYRDRNYDDNEHMFKFYRKGFQR